MAQIQDQIAPASSSSQATSTTTPVAGDAFQSLWDESKYHFYYLVIYYDTNILLLL
jgi:hypothetical protein